MENWRCLAEWELFFVERMASVSKLFVLEQHQLILAFEQWNDHVSIL